MEKASSKSKFAEKSDENIRPRGVQSVARAVQLLYAVGRHNESGIRLSDLARSEGLHVATAKRILSVLVKEKLIFHDPVSKHYRLGYGIYSLGQSAIQYTIMDQLRTVLEKIAFKTEDSVFLIIPSGLDTICIEHIVGPYPIRASTVTVGTRRPIGIGAAGLAMLAKMPAARVRQLISANRERYRTFEGLTAEKIEAMVEETRQRGYAVFDRRAGRIYTAVGLPVLNDKNEPVAGIGVSAIHSRITAERRKKIVAVMKAELLGVRITA